MVAPNILSVSFDAISLATLKTDVDTWLAAQSDLILRSWSPTVHDRSRRLGVECNIMIGYGTSLVPIADPWEMEVFEAGTLADVQALVLAFMVAHALDFVSGPKLFAVDNATNNKLIKYAAILFWNTDPAAFQNYGETAGMAVLPP